MTITRKLAAASSVVMALCALSVGPSWGQQSVLRSQTDEVQRAISEALREANAEQRRNAARAVPPRREPQSPETPTPEGEGPPIRSDEPPVQPVPGGDRR